MAHWWRRNLCAYSKLCSLVLAALTSPAIYAADLFAPGSGAFLTHIDKQHSTTSWAAVNLLDDTPSTRWLSNRRDNDLIFAFDSDYTEHCFSRFSLQNYGSNRSLKQFMLLRSSDTSLSTNIGPSGWLPVIADPSPVGPVNHLHWGQGGRLTAVDREHSSTTWAGVHINNGNLGDYWLSNRSNNTLDFAFDSDWNGSNGNAINVTQLKLHNYGSNRSIQWFQVEVSPDGTNWSKLEVPGTAAGDSDFNFLLSHEGGVLDVVNREHSSTTWAGANIHDGSNQTIWLSNRTNNNLDFSFNPNGIGATGLAGDSLDYFTLDKIILENYGSSRSVKQFQIFVKVAGSNNWVPLPVPGSTANQPDFNFLLSHEGAALTDINKQHSTTTWAAANIHDGSRQTIWLSNRTNNTLDFNFDMDTNGTPAEVTDQFTVEKIVMENYGSNRSVEKFQVEVKTATESDWTKLEVPGTDIGVADFNFLSMHEGAGLTLIDKQHSSTTWAAANIHDSSPQTIWLSNRQTNTLEFDFDTDLDTVRGDAVNFSKIKLRNYGSNRSVATFELDVKISGGAWQSVPAPGGGTVFNAVQSSAEQEWSVANQSNVTAFRIRTLSNYGDTYTGIRELEILGTSTGPTHTFVATKPSTEQAFILDGDDQPSEVTAVRFRSISNYGDTYTGVRELRVLGKSVTRSRVFEANQASTAQIFELDPADRPEDVVAVRLQTIENYGDTYTGIRELQLVGTSVTASHTFVATKPSTAQVFTLDAEDTVSNVVAARLHTIRNYGDTYTGAREFELLGDPEGPLYLFDAEKTATEQVWNLSATSGKLFRFHTFENYGDTYTGSSELGLEPSSACYPDPIAAWHLDEGMWGSVTDSSGNGLHGEAYNEVTTDNEIPAIAGEIGTCRYGVFDGSDDYLSIPHNNLLNGTNSFTYMAWINSASWSGIRQIMDKSIHGGSSGRAQMGIFSQSGVLKGRAETTNGRVTIEAALPSLNTWTHVALVFEGTSLKLYINGSLSAFENFSGTTLIGNSDPLQIGRRTLSNQYYFKGSIDEVRVYAEGLTSTQVPLIMNLTHPCTSAINDDAMGFNCVVPGGDDLSGRLYTQTSGQPFVMDIVALKDADGDDVADGRETNFALNVDRDITVELVDGSSGESCEDHLPIAPAVNQILSFTSTDEGIKPTGDFSVAKAYRALRCRVTDATQEQPVVGCSTDQFAIRPTQLNLQVPVLTNSGDSGDPKQAAGSNFTLQAISGTAGYDGTPEINLTKLEAHSGAVQEGLLAGNFTAADSASGNAEGVEFSYSEVGSFRIQSQGLFDADFTAIDQPSDCVDDFSNTPDGSGKIGCKFANVTDSLWVGRFIPDHLTIDINNNGVLANTCAAGGFSYSGQPIGYFVGQTPKSTITAWNALATPTITKNYTGTYSKLSTSSVVIPDVTSDKNQLGADGSTLLALTWDVGGADLVDQNNGTIQFNLRDDAFIYGRAVNDQVAPFTAAIELEITGVADLDGVTATGLPKIFQLVGGTVQFGRLAFSTAHGSELKTLNVPLRVEYFNGANIGFVLNTADQCTTDLTLSLSDLDSSDGLLVSDGADKETAIYAPVSVAGGYSADDLSNSSWLFSQPAIAGMFNLNLQAPGLGNGGSALVHIDAPDWLKYRWIDTSMTSPISKVTFGIHSRPGTTILFMRNTTGQ